MRHNEYYGMQDIFDELYDRSRKGETFHNLMELVLTENNIRLAYRNIKARQGSKTSGTDDLTIEVIKKMPVRFVLDMIRSIVLDPLGYKPQPVREKLIPKPNGGYRPLGIPSIVDRLIQQCIKQILEPIFEARFSENSHGFRALYSTETAIAVVYRRMHLSKLFFVIEVDIKGFFDNVNHRKLRKALWRYGIRDKTLIWIITQIIKGEIRKEDGTLVKPEKGIKQGSQLSPLLANLYLDLLDKWLESQWINHPVTRKYSISTHKNGSMNKGTGYRAMKKTGLKEIFHTRYADDVFIQCRSKKDAQRLLIALEMWLEENLSLKLSKEKTRIVDVRKKDAEFLGFRIRLRPKGRGKRGNLKWTVHSRMSHKAFKKAEQNLREQIRRIKYPDKGKNAKLELLNYNSMVTGIQNYYQKATEISQDLGKLNRKAETLFHSKNLKRTRKGRKLTPFETERFGKSRRIRYLYGEPVYPIGYGKHQSPYCRRNAWNIFTPEGRKEIHKFLNSRVDLLWILDEQPERDETIEYHDNRISHFTAQKGFCAVTGLPFLNTREIHCHHITPRQYGGDDSYSNLVCVLEEVHILIHASKPETIRIYLDLLMINRKQLNKLNKYRKSAFMEPIKAEMLP